MNAKQEQFEIFCEQFLESEEWLPYHSVRNYELVVERAKTRIAAAGNYVSYSALEITAAELIAAGIIKKQYEPTAEDEAIRAASQPVQPLALTAAQYQSLPSDEVKRRYRQEPAFRAACDVLYASGAVR